MMKNLLENECGVQNPLVRLTNQLSLSSNHHRSAASANATAATKFQSTTDDDFVNEYLSSSQQQQQLMAAVAPNTFHMGSLLKQRLQPQQQQQQQMSMNEALVLNDGNNSTNWSNEYIAAAASVNNEQPSSMVTSTRRTADSLKWSVDYLNQTDESLATNNTAKPIIFNRQTIPAATAGNFVAKNGEAELNVAKDLSEQWIDEFQKEEQEAIEKSGADFWSEFQNEWKSSELFDGTGHDQTPWLEEFQKTFDSYRAYEFDEQNELASHPNPFAEGLERLKVHDIVNAVLLFEAAVRKEPANMLAWQYLGTTQVENEQDVQAIRALRKCLELKPDNLIALSTIAASYTNESMQRLAFDALLSWLKLNPNYSRLFDQNERARSLWTDLLARQSPASKTDTNKSFYNILGVVHPRDFVDLQHIYLDALQQSASKSIDPDLQCCLGILFHLSADYDKAADCFRTALQVTPGNHLLWNKLGATYANGNRNEESIQAYYQALKLCPGFVRARYNLGIGCLNLKAYRESVEHFLTALVQQSQANIDEPTTNKKTTTSSNRNKQKQQQQMSETIWTTLRLSLSYLNRADLFDACNQKNLDLLRDEFKV